MHAFKRSKNKTVSVIVTVAIIISLLLGVFTFARPVAHAEDDEITEFEPVSIGLSNTQFDSTSGSYPANPSSWTGATVGGGNGSVVAGVIDLTATSYFGTNSGNKKFKLDQYPEYANEKSMPQTIFGSGSAYSGSDAKTLMINTEEGAETAYAYTSGDMSFLPNSFYRISAWVKTGNFAADTGATIKLSGLGQNCSFMNINTVKDLPSVDGVPTLTKENRYGWVKYSFYVRTSASLTKTVKLVLGIGDAVTNTDEDPDILPRYASGYAFFDTVSAERISAHDFATETEYFSATDRDNVYKNGLGTSLAIDLNEAKSFMNGDKEIGTFSSDIDAWQKNIYYDENSEDRPYAGAAESYTYNAIPDLNIKDNIYGFTQRPWTPFGRAEYSTNGHPMFDGTNANIMLINTYDYPSKQFKEAAYGIASPFVNIERFKYYRFSVWVKGDSVEGGNGITVAVKGKSINGTKIKSLTEYTGLEGDASDNAHYGWKEQIIYIQGSALTDYTVKFELWLGAPNALSKGIAMFDNVTFTELTYTQYTEMSAADGGNVYAIDGTATDTGITNGSFTNVGDLSDGIQFPLPVAEWSFMTPDTVNTRGFSNNKVNTDNAVYGLLPTDNDTFYKISSSGRIPSVVNPSRWSSSLNNVLLLSSTTPTAFCYQSPSITLSTDTANKLTVDMAVNGVTNGKGAALVLKTTDGDVLSTIENIGNTDGFKTYTFYLAAPLTDHTVFVEIWLGLNDRFNNSQKLSNGNIYVRNVALNAWTASSDEGAPTVAQEYAEILAQYKSDITNNTLRNSLDYGVYSFADLSLDYYDIYSYADNDGLGLPYQWSSSFADSSTVISGMFNSDYMKNLTIYDGFDKKDMSGNMLYIFNTEKNRTTYTHANTLSLVANMYYRIDVSVKVRVTDEVRKDKTSVGANIKLTGANAEFSNIKDTTTLGAKNNEESRDYETFKTYSFYVATGDNGGNIGLEISFGGADRASYIQGKLVVGGITMTEIDNLDFEAAEKDTKNQYVKAVKLSETANTDDDNTSTEATSSDIQWWIIPTIIFSAALIAVIVIIIVVRVRDRIKRKKKVTYASEYDRSDVMRDIERLQAQKDEDEANAALDTVKSEEPAVDSDDDDNNYVSEADEKAAWSEETQKPAVSDDAKNNATEDLDD